jgi:hypothetical protein
MIVMATTVSLSYMKGDIEGFFTRGIDQYTTEVTIVRSTARSPALTPGCAP